ncbi:4-amino-4-deoxy-L-arabinose transferase-like glycosyltransferase [Novosphingobium sp. PhB165]|uniref:hypothetical protein n=1 Tax=Novosphingobium sp. PhB165 TaxID=2485105 RepID=UPI00104AAE98|nr:hypothetical protein [Novosphingobium sp. PhB165]TCM21903.1 4-amino-4-deoxy-L-arabinose transferase-like glycosyltransferase [Novosphingobium sp. PhB165]
MNAETTAMKAQRSTDAAPSLLHAGIALPTGYLAQFLLLLTVAALFRFPVFGEWNYDVDDQFYALVGQRMLDGATLYVDIWDRKGPVLYLIYAAVALISRGPLAWQLAATLFAAAGAFGITRIAELWTSPRGALMAAIGYLAMLNRFEGATGQAQVFYNTLMIAAAWAIATRIDLLRAGRIDKRLIAGMICGGLAIATKQSAAFESFFFGLFCATLLATKGRTKPLRFVAQVASLALCGALPILLTALWYWQAGHFDALWHALVTSNFTRAYDTSGERIQRLAAMIGLLGFPIAFAALTLSTLPRTRTTRLLIAFHAMWFAVAFLAVAAFPNIYLHYALPLLAPLCVLSAGFFDRPGRIAVIGLAALVAVNLFYSGVLDLPARARARLDMQAFEAYVHAVTPSRRLLVWGSPSFLYARIGAAPPDPLAFPRHLYDGAEAGASGTDEVALVHDLLAARPETVVVQEDLLAWPLNQANVRQVSAYLHNCRTARAFAIEDHRGPVAQTVYSGCSSH